MGVLKKPRPEGGAEHSLIAHFLDEEVICHPQCPAVRSLSLLPDVGGSTEGRGCAPSLQGWG